MSASPPLVRRLRLGWPVLVLIAVASAALWLLDTHQPRPWPDAASPWFEHARARSPAGLALDTLNGVAPLTPDLPLGSALVLLALGSSVLASLIALDVPPWLAVGVAVGVLGCRSLWSTVTTGHDALAVLMVSLAVWTIVRPARTGARMLAVLAVPLVAAPAAWLAAPALALRHRNGLRAAAGAALLVAAALVVQAALAWQAWSAATCLAAGTWPGLLSEVWRPGLSADASPLLALRQWAAVLLGDVHAFGIALAAFGLAATPKHAATLRRASLLAVGAGLVTVATGLLPPAQAAALLLPWWAPWFAIGLTALVDRATGRERAAAMTCAVLVAALTPGLRAGTVVPGPWVAGTPATARTVAVQTRETAIATPDAMATRRLRQAGSLTIPATSNAIAACVAAGGRVGAVGGTVTEVERAGFTLDEVTLRVPLADLLRDVRDDQLVAVALAPAALPWAGREGVSMLHRIGLSRDRAQAAAAAVAVAVALIGRTGAGGEVDAGRESANLARRAGDPIGGHRLVEPVSASARVHAADVDSPPLRLATGTHAAVVVFDRAQDIVLRSAAAAAPGLPVALRTHAQWRYATVRRRAPCVTGGTAWVALPGAAPRIGVPVAAASPTRPVLAYVAAPVPPRPDIHGLDASPAARHWSTETFDTRIPDQQRRLRSHAARDDVPPEAVPEARFVARVSIGPRSTWHASHVALSAGASEASWAIRLAADGRHAWTTDVCGMDAAGERLFFGHFGVVDEDSPHEVRVWSQAGWHAPERLHRHVHQWTSRPRATIGFRLASARPLALALDASPASTPTTPQRLTVRVNGHVISDDWQGAARVQIPAALLHEGGNTLTLEVPDVVQPRGDARRLGVLVRELRLIDLRPN